jgi:hypothetical protein
MQLRLSQEMQHAFRAARTAAGGRGDGWLDVVELLQRRVAADFGLPEVVGLDAMRRAEALLPGDAEVVKLSLYRKYNRCIDGPMQAGDAAPDADLLALGGAAPTTLHALLRDRAPWRPGTEGPAGSRPLAVLVGSYT